MPIFRLKDFTGYTLNDAPAGVRWHYDRVEIWADGVVHGIGVCAGLVAAIILLMVAFSSVTATTEFLAVGVYVAGLVAMLSVSAVYNLVPVSRWKWLLRRFDHSAIYLLIAATYTPIIVQMKGSMLAAVVLIGVWAAAILGIALKIFLPGRFDKLSIGLYLAMGWSGVMIADVVVSTLSNTTLWLIALGGLLYSGGVIFHVWERLRFQNAIWHAFVLLGAGCHYTAVLDLTLG